MILKKVIPLTLSFSLLAAMGVTPLENLIKGDSQIQQVEAATPTPVELPLEYISDLSMEKESGYLFDIGNKKGTVVFKIYPGEKNSQFASFVKLIKRDAPAPIYLKKDMNPDSEAFSIFYSVTAHEPGETLPKVGVNKKGKEYIAGAVYFGKMYNNDGKYLLTAPAVSSKDYYQVKAYFYEGVNVQKQVIGQVGKNFPLLAPVKWGKTELRGGQLGRLTVLKNTPLYKLDGDKKIFSRTLKAGQVYRIYAFKPGKLSVGGGYYVDRDKKVKYETPAKNKLKLVKMVHED